ncbi:MAG TPA: NYN domain-containing protein, partial [Bacteroidetes bacterium]|nr:NYN domain-containing protein [Bacteroidota bacterium]HEX04503.1 NYN domain-containing protein [Bacteroidota bacterium]
MTRDKENLIALFIDYDNIAIGLKETTGKPFEVRTVLERLLEKGRIIYKRAYADWYLFSEGKHALHEHAIEMIDIPMRRNIGKNSADIRLVVDALDLCYTKEHIETFVIGSGDSDFTPL